MWKKPNIVGALTTVSLALSLLSAAESASARDRAPQSQPSVPQAQTELAGLSYTVRIEGVADSDLLEKLTRVSDLMEKRGTPPATVAALRSRAADDVMRLEKLMRSEAYYMSRITPRIVRADQGYDVILEVDAGARARLTDLAIQYVAAAAADLPRSAGDLGIELGGPARGARIVDVTGQVVSYLRNHGYPDAKLERRTVTLKAKAAEIAVTLHMDAGAFRTFGDLTVSGLETVDETYVRKLVGWSTGDPYDQSRIVSIRNRLRKTGLFDAIDLKPQTADTSGEMPMVLAVSERAPRSIGVGARWSSDQGAGARASWEHRNLLGAAESLRFTLNIAETEQSLRGEFRKPRFLRPDQALLATFDLAREETTAYDEDRVKAGLGLERSLSDYLRATAAVNFEWSRTRDSGVSETSQLLSLPLTAAWDRTDDLLDPTRGERVTASLTPFAGRSGTAVYFLRAEASASHYLTLDALPDTTLATRARLGSILADQFADIPSSIRFYAGGGGSLRGYAFQEAGPLDAAGDPVGGRSVIELGAELRHRFTDTIGAVAFFEAGNVDTKSTPNLSDRPLMSAGIGARYYTAVGPVRADIAFPLEKRAGDDSFQIYLSLGQAF